MAHATAGGAEAPFAAPLCDRSKIDFIETTLPQEGGFGKLRIDEKIQPHVSAGCTFRCDKLFAGIVRHARMNGIEVAFKSPKTKLLLNDRDFTAFKKEIELQLKVSACIRFFDEHSN